MITNHFRLVLIHKDDHFAIMHCILLANNFIDKMKKILLQLFKKRIPIFGLTHVLLFVFYVAFMFLSF